MLSTLRMRPSMPRRDRVRQQRNGGKDERGQQNVRQHRIVGQYQPDHAIELDGQQGEGHGVVEIVHDRHMRPPCQTGLGNLPDGFHRQSCHPDHSAPCQASTSV